MTAGAKLRLNTVYQYGLQTLQLVQSGLQLRDTKLVHYILDHLHINYKRLFSEMRGMATK
jgi:hypothetical protein